MNDPSLHSFVLANFENKVLKWKISMSAACNQLAALANFLLLEDKHNGETWFIYDGSSRYWDYDDTPDDTIDLLEKFLDRQHMSCHY